MDDVVLTFPLLRLPINAMLNTLRSMTHLEIIGISTLSKRTKNLVESLKLTAKPIPVFVTDSFEVHLSFPNNCLVCFELYLVLENEPLQELETPADVYVLYNENPYVPWANVMSVKQLLDHLQCIFHASLTRLYFGSNCERFSLESIQKTVKDFQRICFISENQEQNRRVLSIFQPAELILFEAAFDDGHAPRYISVQNFDCISVHSARIVLDDLLVTNARSISLICNTFSMKILNQFLKLWTKGSNRQLEHLFLQFSQTDFRGDELLRGLKCQYVPMNRGRFFKVPGIKEPQEVIGGRELWRFDGTKATVICRRSDEHVYVNLFVWYDHCILH